jgi:uncharacterized damage-inducible protein DinB
MTESLKSLFDRDLKRVQNELSAYSDERLIWTTSKGISNSAGNLALHIAGNLQHFVGAIIGETGYVRKREEEFSKDGLSLQEVLHELDFTRVVVSESLEKLNEGQLSHNYPISVFGEEMTTEWFLLHLIGHLNYHLGQINYHRRILDIK